MELIVCALLLGCLMGALVQRFIMARLPTHKHWDLSQWLILIEDGARAARDHAGHQLLAAAGHDHQPTPEERAFLYGWYRQYDPTLRMPFSIMEAFSLPPVYICDEHDEEDCSICKEDEDA